LQRAPLIDVFLVRKTEIGPDGLPKPVEKKTFKIHKKAPEQPSLLGSLFALASPPPEDDVVVYKRPTTTDIPKPNYIEGWLEKLSHRTFANL